MALPKLTDEQRQAALDKAAESRRARAELCDRIRRKELSVEDVLSMVDDPIVGRLKVSKFIESIPGYGKRKTEKLMEELRISPTRRVQGLGSRQREKLLRRLGA